jgi:prepilin-type processing-associated H-X9-DG protein
VCFIEPPRSQIPPPHNRTSSDQYFFSGHIIAILAAILFPVFARAREKARQTSCLNNVKQLSLAVMQYTQDYDEVLPASFYPGNPVGTRFWYEKIQPYVNNTQVQVCPSARTRAIGYGWNYDFIGYGSSTTCRTYTLADIKRPAETIMMADAGNYVIYSPSRYNFEPSPGTVTYDYNAAGLRHNDGANIGFCDGHAKWMHANDYLYSTDLWDRE